MSTDSFMTLSATITPSSSHNSNLSLNSPPSWLVEMYSKLWGRHDLFGEIFRTATLTEDHFIELQRLLEALNPERNSDKYVAKNVLATKSTFLYSRSTALDVDADVGNGPVPRLLFDAPHPLTFDVVDNDDDDAIAVDDDDSVVDDPMPVDIDPVNIYMDHLFEDAPAIFPNTIRYIDLTILKPNARVPQLILYREEWGSLIDIFNERDKGILGSAVVSGQPGIGEHRYWYLTIASNQ